MKIQTIITCCVLAGALGLAQDAPDRPPREGGRGGPGGQGGPGGPGGPRFVPPLMATLDANRDGTIDENEIAQSSANLKKLDRNGDGKLTPEELRPPARGDGGPGPGPRGDRGDRPRRPPGDQ